ncbi:hypothetical protein DFH07DRAFT_965750 [Mycena maculata]|uniref:Uncharacterized protein n=1 Tax=Mycena maculata TaxID=230809 RepID=A0AAD7N0X9_9AGAR|nr:hypothetical protein DFH07DRAFT_965750 [Mycena maculata]
MATFCNVPLSTSLDLLSEHSRVSLDWILISGVPASRSSASGVLTLPSGNTIYSMHMKLSVTAGLPYDLVLGRDWVFFCRQTLPHTSFSLSSGIVSPGQPRISSLSEASVTEVVPPSPVVGDNTADMRPQSVSAMSLWFVAVHLRLVLHHL